MAADLSALIAGSTLAYEIDFLAVRLFVTGTRRVNELLAEIGLRARSYSALAASCSALPLRQRDLVSLLELDPSQVVALLGELEKDGLIRREPDPDDRRTNLIRPTEQGRRLADRGRRITAAAERETLAMLTPAEQETLRALLGKVVLTHAATRSAAD